MKRRPIHTYGQYGRPTAITNQDKQSIMQVAVICANTEDFVRLQVKLKLSDLQSKKRSYYHEVTSIKTIKDSQQYHTVFVSKNAMKNRESPALIEYCASKSYDEISVIEE